MMGMMKVVVAAASLALATSAVAWEKPGFPRTGANWIAKQDYQDASIREALSKKNVALISVWPGWESGRGMTVEQVIKDIKARNPNTLVFNYIINNEVPQAKASYGGYSELYDRLDSTKSYLYSSGACCSIVNAIWPGAIATNNTLFGPKDANGDRYIEWYAKWAVRQYATPAPSLDGFNSDNIFWKPRVNGDYNRDGTVDDANNATVGQWYRQGEVRHFEVLRQLMPGKFQIGNIADWGHYDAVTTEYKGMLNGGVLEAMIGEDYSVEAWAGFSGMMTWYRKTMALLAEPKLGLFHQVGDPKDYRSMRYGLTSTLMDDGYYVFNIKGNAGADAVWFDEYGAKLGQSVSSPPTGAWQKGVWRRDFEGGIALVNPKGNGAQTVTLEGDFKRISGTQDSGVNNGQTTRTVTLQDRDGIILLRPQSLAKPRAPTSVSIQ